MHYLYHFSFIYTDYLLTIVIYSCWSDQLCADSNWNGNSIQKKMYNTAYVHREIFKNNFNLYTYFTTGKYGKEMKKIVSRIKILG